MGKTLDLGRRIEIHSLDRHCHSISIGLYRRSSDAGCEFHVHTYSPRPEAQQRIEFVERALVALLGMAAVPQRAGWQRFPCGDGHEKPLRRAFLDLCRLASDVPLTPKPLETFDKKANSPIRAVSLGERGAYRVVAVADSEDARRRALAVANGLVKVCEMQSAEGSEIDVAFSCGMNHDALLAMLLGRAQNVRAALQEEEQAGGRGVLAPPSQQK